MTGTDAAAGAGTQWNLFMTFPVYCTISGPKRGPELSLIEIEIMQPSSNRQGRDRIEHCIGRGGGVGLNSSAADR